MGVTVTSEMQWARSSRCESSHCIEIMVPMSGGVLMRDAKDPAGPRLGFGPDAWRAFVQEVQKERFVR